VLAGIAPYALIPARLWGAAERLRESFEHPLRVFEAIQLQDRIALAREAIKDDEAFDRAWQEGRGMTLDEAVELALMKV